MACILHGNQWCTCRIEKDPTPEQVRKMAHRLLGPKVSATQMVKELARLTAELERTKAHVVQAWQAFDGARSGWMSASSERDEAKAENERLRALAEQLEDQAETTEQLHAAAEREVREQHAEIDRLTAENERLRTEAAHIEEEGDAL